VLVADSSVYPIGLYLGGFTLLLLQIPATLILLSRLLKGPFRRPPIQPQPDCHVGLGIVSVIVPTLNEATRIRPCLEGLLLQGEEVREILVVDSRSKDGTQDIVRAYQTKDPRVKLLTDDPLPQGWVGRPWALDYGFRHSSPETTWVLGIDADTQPQSGLVSALVANMEQDGCDLVSLAPKFILKSPGEFWLQPALLITLVYRFGPAGSHDLEPQRAMANGQCFMVRRSWLEHLNGYQTAKSSFCDDVTLARNLAVEGAKVRFWDGSPVLWVRMYEGIWETWREWGRSLDLKDASSPAQLWGDVSFLVMVQGLPWLLVPLLIWLRQSRVVDWALSLQLLLGVNIALLGMRLGMQAAVASAYRFQGARGSWAFALSPLADLLAVLRIGLSSLQTPTQWRGRQYSKNL
jgi:dolichol-phosphate mannosyltransferase